MSPSGVAPRGAVSVAETPALRALWHQEQNHEAPSETAAGSIRKAWWRCPANHEWHATVLSVRNSVRAGNTGCPYCRGLLASPTNSVAALLPDAAVQWDRERNGCGPEAVVAGSNKKFWWRCTAGPDHRWEAAPVSRGKAGCPFCASRRVSVTNRLDLLNPELAAEWHPNRNGDLTPSGVVAGSHLKVWWRCATDRRHEWQAAVVLRTYRRTGCPYCSGRRATADGNLAVARPQVAALWHGHRNGPASPEDVTSASDRVCWWQCPVARDHYWQAAVKTLVLSARNGTTGCPMCSGLRPSVTNSVAAHPVLSRQWHPTRNLPRTAETTVAGTSRHLWWRCETDPAHEWDATGANRTRDRGCPWCKGHQRGTLEVCLAYELQTLFDGIDLTADKIRVGPRELLAVDILLPAERIAIEVDGRYRHADREDRDAAKSAQLRKAGWRVMRVREEPLVVISDADVVVPQEPTVKQVADLVLRGLRDLGWASPPGLNQYLAEPRPRRQAEALTALSLERGGAKVREPGRPKGPNRPQRWETKYALLAAFSEREGHACPVQTHVEDGHKIGSWAAQQRVRHRAGELEPDRVARLAALPGWTWAPDEDAFDVRYRLLLEHVRRHGHAYVPVQHVQDGVALGEWVRSLQRATARPTPTQRRRLDALPGWTWYRTAHVHGAGHGQGTLFWLSCCFRGRDHAT